MKTILPVGTRLRRNHTRGDRVSVATVVEYIERIDSYRLSWGDTVNIWTRVGLENMMTIIDEGHFDEELFTL